MHAGDLHVGDLLEKADGSTLSIEKIDDVAKHATVYNFTVAEHHTYFVTDLGIWVHDTNCFNGSASDLVNLANNSKKIDRLSDTVVQIDKIYKAAELFVGENYIFVQ